MLLTSLPCLESESYQSHGQMQFGGLPRLYNINRDGEVLINMKLKNVCNPRPSLNEPKHFAV